MKVKLTLKWKNDKFISFKMHPKEKLRTANPKKEVWIYTDSFGVLHGKVSINNDDIVMVYGENPLLKMVDLENVIGWIYSPEKFFKNQLPAIIEAKAGQDKGGQS